MCGRYTLQTNFDSVAEQFHVEALPAVKPRYNIAPSQWVPCVRKSADSLNREGVMLHWGLIPSWAKDPPIGIKLINARAETLTQRPAFRNAFRHRRCLVLGDGFYEWRREGRVKQPYYIRMKDKRPFAFAGIWERWIHTEDKVVESCALITIAPNDVVAPIHNRMPVIVPPCRYDEWLDPMNQDSEQLRAFLVAYPAEEMEAYPVSKLVNNARIEDPRCLEEIRV